ncbi:Copia protein [Sesamum angolense]|uniref:Copia protein n=1 Tax=Sesamum angolense TaxID=2727404 RepID=A0AAE1WW88_9LAMI|nr:Copia protein [Sesamum angolense]
MPKVEGYKARLIAEGYKPNHSVYYEEVFAPVACLETIQLLIALAVHNRWLIHQMDVKFPFLNDTLEEVYDEQSDDFMIKGHEDNVLKLIKVLYGLKQAPRACDYAGDVDDHKSTIGLVFYFGYNAISCSRKQPIVTISTCHSKSIRGASPNQLMCQAYKERQPPYLKDSGLPSPLLLSGNINIAKTPNQIA